MKKTLIAAAFGGVLVSGFLTVSVPAAHAEPFIYASGQFNWRTANLGMVLPGHPPTTLDSGQTYHINGWTILPSGDGITFTNDGTGHGMTVGSDQSVNPF